MRVYEGRGTWEPKEGMWQWVWDERERERFPSLFYSPTHVFLLQDDYYFLTDPGVLSLAPKPEAGKQRATRVLWNDAQRPIKAVLVDVDRNQPWVFARWKDGQDEVFFELAREIKLHRVERAPIIRPMGIEGRLRVVLEYAQLLPNRRVSTQRPR